MNASCSVELVVAGARLPVRRDSGFALVERNRRLLTEGRVEAVRVTLEEWPRAVLHLLLGAAQIGLIEPWPPEPGAARPTSGRPEPTAQEAFVDFDAYAR